MSKPRAKTPYHLDRRDGTIDAKHPTDRITLGANFKHLIPEGETLTAGAVTVTPVHGTDPDPSALKDGGAAAVGDEVRQAFKGGLEGVRYCLAWSGTLSNGDTITRHTLLLVSAKC